MFRRFAAVVFLWQVLSCASATGTVTFDWAAVDNPGNAPDATGYGAVEYAYRISKHEVTNAQYTEFLNAAAATDTNALYNDSMDSDPRGGITQNGSSGSFTYAVKSGRAQNPVVFVSFYDAMRFVNWLENGQPTGAQGPGTTEDGVYAISDGLSEIRDSAATYFVPSEDEWYKAAYHKNDGVTGDYWQYPTATDSVPFSDQPPGSDAPDQSNTANFLKNDLADNGYDDGYAVTASTTLDLSLNYLTDVGAYPQSVGPYGTFDMGGNANEWNEAVVSTSFRGVRGGQWGSLFGILARSFRGNGAPTTETFHFGFRVASIPEPSTLLLALTAAVLAWQRRRLPESS